MIKAHCRTNLDDYKGEEWPPEFAETPREGDWVEAKSGKILKVVKVTHKYSWPNNTTRFLSIPVGPYIEVELHKVVG